MQTHVQSAHALGEMMSSSVWECHSLRYHTFLSSTRPLQVFLLISSKELVCQLWEPVYALAAGSDGW